MMKVPPTSPATQKAYEAIYKTLSDQDVEAGAMFGMPSMKKSGKAFAGIFGDSLVFKLTGEAHAKALALAGAKLFDPSGMGRAMKEWVVVPNAHAAKWAALAKDSLAYVSSAPAKKSAPKKSAAKKTAKKISKPAAKKPAQKKR